MNLKHGRVKLFTSVFLDRNHEFLLLEKMKMKLKRLICKHVIWSFNARTFLPILPVFADIFVVCFHSTFCVVTFLWTDVRDLITVDMFLKYLIVPVAGAMSLKSTSCLLHVLF